MQCNEIQNHFADYVRETLEPSVKTELARHLRECEACRAELDGLTEVWVGLGSFPAPEAASPEMDVRFRLALDAEKRAQSARANRRWGLYPVAAALLVAAAIVIIGGLSLRRSNSERPRQVETVLPPENVRQVKSDPPPSIAEDPSWQVSTLRGAPRVGASAISAEGRLRVGEALHTDASSAARVKIADIGELHVDPNTLIRLLVTQPGQHRIALDRGRLEVKTTSRPRVFIVDTPTAVAVDLGCRYTLEVEDDGGSLLHVLSGVVALETGDRETVVPAGAMSRTRPRLGPGAPYFEDASEAFRSALDRVELTAGDPDRGRQLDVVIRESRRDDVLTLWHLLPRVEEPLRGGVYDRLAEFAHPPAGVTREGIIGLDRKMLNSWKGDVSQIWQAAARRHKTK